ncbi:MAG: type II toxin-antitoxin system VapC family toxin [Flavobacteriales bacterium]|nr:type II toxin-antitoxin system VapC family toxin [Flavobacteriales bacterium]
MKLLIDTHAVIWFITEDKELPRKVKSIIEDRENSCYVSIASLWEMGIKYALGRLELKPNLKKIFELIDDSGITILPITSAHILRGSTS